MWTYIQCRMCNDEAGGGGAAEENYKENKNNVCYCETSSGQAGGDYKAYALF